MLTCVTGSKSITNSLAGFCMVFAVHKFLQCLFYTKKTPKSPLFLSMGPLFLRAATMEADSRDLPFHPPLGQCGALHRPGTRVSAARAILSV